MIVPPDDSEAMAAAICHLADDAAERRRLGENARHRAETE
jgi:glycosyltransferase involved in cell wall biosynthesis